MKELYGRKIAQKVSTQQLGYHAIGCYFFALQAGIELKTFILFEK